MDSIGDALNTGCYVGECSFDPAYKLTFSSDSNGFTISGGTIADPDVTHTYMTADYVPGSYQTAPGGEVGIKYSVTFDDVALWTALEQAWSGGTADATTLPVGTVLVFDLHNSGTDDAVADMTPAETTVTPEPATLTLLCSGLAAGLLRKRLARMKA